MCLDPQDKLPPSPTQKKIEYFKSHSWQGEKHMPSAMFSASLTALPGFYSNVRVPTQAENQGKPGNEFLASQEV